MDNSKYSPFNVLKNRSGESDSSATLTSSPQPQPQSQPQAQLQPQAASNNLLDNDETFDLPQNIKSWSPLDEPLPEENKPSQNIFDAFSNSSAPLTSPNPVSPEIQNPSVTSVPPAVPVSPATPVSPTASVPPAISVPSAVSIPPTTPVPPPSNVNADLQMPELKTKPNQKKGNGLNAVAVAGIVLLILIALVVPYVLVKNGVRVPVLYPIMSKLPTSGTNLNSQALSLVKEKGEVSAAGVIEIIAKSADKVPTTSLADSEETALITSYANKFDNGFNEVKSDSWLVDSMLSIDKKSSIRSQVQSPKSDDANKYWYIYFADEDSSSSSITSSSLKLDTTSSTQEDTTANYVVVKGDQMSDTFLQASLRPLSFSNLAEAVNGVKSYDFGTSNDKNFARYVYTVNASKLTDCFPTNATLENSEFTALYNWGSSLPYKYAFKTDLSYLGTTYSYTSTINISKYDSSASKISALDVFLRGIDTIKAGKIEESTMQKMVVKYGLKGVEVLPNVLAENSTSKTTGDTTSSSTPTPTASASPSASPTATSSATASASPTASPSASPSASSAIKPSGESISALVAAISTSPVAPSLVASTQGKSRDVQRKQDLSDLQTALANYKKKYGYYPMVKTSEQTLSSQTLFSALVPEFLTAMPVDPLKSTYYYEYKSVDGYSYILRSIAEDSSDLQAKKGGVYYYFEKAN